MKLTHLSIAVALTFSGAVAACGDGSKQIVGGQGSSRTASPRSTQATTASGATSSSTTVSAALPAGVPERVLVFGSDKSLSLVSARDGSSIAVPVPAGHAPSSEAAIDRSASTTTVVVPLWREPYDGSCPRLYRLSSAGGSAQDLGLVGHSPAISSDGKNLAYVANAQNDGRCTTTALAVRNLVDGTEKRWTWDPQYSGTSFLSLTWNSDATLLAFAYSQEGVGPVAILDPNSATGDIRKIARTVPLSAEEWTGGPTFTSRGLAINVYCCGTRGDRTAGKPQKSEIALVNPTTLALSNRVPFPADADAPPVLDPTGQLMIFRGQNDTIVRTAADGTGRVTLPKNGSPIAW